MLLVSYTAVAMLTLLLPPGTKRVSFWVA
uniref:Uncharacterized protein n=1 Tax=Arundo donax TaxID=35708 RepID=A0A0A8Z6Y8_ARUDO